MTREEFKAARLALGLSQSALSRELGLKATATLSRWEQGVHPVPDWAGVTLALLGKARKVVKN